MGLPSDARDFWAAKRQSFLIPSPHEYINNSSQRQLTFEEEKAVRAKRCSDEGVREGLKAAGIACVASTIPTLTVVRVIPWAKANLNYVAQALIISAGQRHILKDQAAPTPWRLPNPLLFGLASISSYFIVAEKTILKCSRQNTIKQYKDLQSE